MHPRTPPWLRPCDLLIDGSKREKPERSLTCFPWVLLQSESTDDTVMALVTAAVKMAIRQTPVRIHSTENIRPYIVRGTLSPYLKE